MAGYDIRSGRALADYSGLCFTAPQMNRYVLGTGRSAVLCGAAANVFVDAVSGTVLENRFATEKSIS